MSVFSGLTCLSVTELDRCCEKYKRRTWSFLRVGRGGQERMHKDVQVDAY